MGTINQVQMGHSDAAVGQQERLMKQQLWTLCGLTFSYYASNAILVATLPLYFVSRGYSSSEIGLLMMLGPFVAIFVQPIWGYVSDRYHTVKKIIYFLWSMTILSSAGLFLTDSYGLALLFMVLIYFFFLPSLPLLDSLAIKTTLQAGTSYGSIRLWGSLGFGLVAVTAGTVISIWGVGMIPYLYYAIWIIPMMLLLRLQDGRGNGKGVSLESLGSILRNLPFLWFLLLVFVLMVPHRMNDAMFVLHMKDLGGSDAMAGWAWALASLSEIPIFALFSRFMHRYHELALLGMVALLYTIRWFLVGLISDPVLLIFLQVMHTFTFAVFWITAVQYAVKLVPEDLRSTGQAMLAAIFLGAAGITGGFVGGWIKEAWGGGTMYFFGAGMAFTAAFLLLLTRAHYRRNSRP